MGFTFKMMGFVLKVMDLFALKGSMNHGGAGAGPWVMADLEKGLGGSNVTHSNEPPLKGADYVIARVKGGDAAGEIPLFCLLHFHLIYYAFCF